MRNLIKKKNLENYTSENSKKYIDIVLIKLYTKVS